MVKHTPLRVFFGSLQSYREKGAGRNFTSSLRGEQRHGIAPRTLAGGANGGDAEQILLPAHHGVHRGLFLRGRADEFEHRFRRVFGALDLERTRVPIQLPAQVRAACELARHCLQVRRSRQEAGRGAFGADAEPGTLDLRLITTAVRLHDARDFAHQRIKRCGVNLLDGRLGFGDLPGRLRIRVGRRQFIRGRPQPRYQWSQIGIVRIEASQFGFAGILLILLILSKCLFNSLHALASCFLCSARIVWV